MLSFNNIFSLSDNASISPGLIKKPLTPSTTTSGIEAILVVILGIPYPIVSNIDIGNPSL